MTKALKIIKSFYRYAGSWIQHNEDNYEHTLNIPGDTLHIYANKHPQFWEFSFDSDKAQKTDDRWKATGEGTYSVFIEVFNIIKEFITEHAITEFLVEAEHERLVPIYQRLINQNFHSANVDLTRHNGTTSFRVTLNKTL